MSKKRAEITSKEIVQILRVILGFLPYVKVTNLNRDTNSAKSAYSGALRLTVSLVQSRRKVVEKDMFPH